MIIPDMSIGQYAVPVLLTVIMMLVYKFIPVIGDRYKAVLTMGVAVGLAIISMFYASPEAVTFQMWVNTIVGGIIIGAAAVGLYEGQRTVTKPRA